MSKKILVNGLVEIIVKEEQYNDLLRVLPAGVVVKDLEGPESEVLDEPYDFDKLIEMANEYSDGNQPDVVKFAQKAWEAASIVVKDFVLRRLHILIKSNSAKAKLLDAICDVGLSNVQSRQVEDAWAEAEKLHSNFYEMNLVKKYVREALLKSIKEMAATIEKANVEAVDTNLKNSTEVKIKYVGNKAYKIGDNSYVFKYVAF